MSLIFTDGFEHYSSNADFLKKWTADSGWGVQTSSAQARTGSRSCTMPEGYKTLPAAAEHATFIIGAGLYRAVNATAQMLFRSDGNTLTHITIYIHSDGSIRAYRGATNGTLLGQTDPGVVPVTSWTYIEAKVTLHDSTGSVTVKVNNTAVLTLTNQDTKNGGTKTVFDSFAFTCGNSSTYLDDIYVCNGAGSTNNDFLGDIKIATLYPSGNGTTKQLTGTGDATNTWNNVDDAQPNTTDYNESTAADQYDTYAMQDLPAGATTVYGVVAHLYALKTDSGTQSIAPMLRSGSTDYEGTAQALGTSYNYYSQIYETDPNTAAAWTVSNVNALEAGAKAKAS